MTQRGQEILNSLTANEQGIIYFIGCGLKNKEIAKYHKTTTGVIKVAVSTIFNKTGTDGRIRLVLLLREHGLMA